jgi:hypothetical protein
MRRWKATLSPKTQVPIKALKNWSNVYKMDRQIDGKSNGSCEKWVKILAYADIKEDFKNYFDIKVKELK